MLWNALITKRLEISMPHICESGHLSIQSKTRDLFKHVN